MTEYQPNTQYVVTMDDTTTSRLVTEEEQLQEYQLSNRCLWLDYLISEEAMSVVRHIYRWNLEDNAANIPAEKRTPIKIFISCLGGEDNVAWSIVDAITMSKTPVWTINAGKAMSNGLTILVAGHKRFTFPHASAMYHSGSAGLEGTKEQIDAVTKYIKAQDKMYEDWFLSKTNIPANIYKKNKKSEWYITAQDTLAYGMVDQTLSSFDDLEKWENEQEKEQEASAT